MRKVAGIILAAGLSNRMNCPKLTLAWGNSTILGSTIRAVKAGGIELLYVITGAYAEEITKIAADHNVQTIFNPSYAEGQSTSLQAGISFFTEHHPAHGAMFILADQPMIHPDTYRALAEAYIGSNALLVRPRAGGKPGNPVIIAPELWPKINDLRDDTGARSLFDTHEEEILWLETADETVSVDIDTIEDYELYLGRGGL
jgi:molybdenum cofactor cytidylyltransferase